MTRILLPTDFSDNSLEAIRYAQLAYTNAECTFYLLHTYTPAIYNTEYLTSNTNHDKVFEVLKEKSIAQLEQLKNHLNRHNTNEKHNFVTHSAFNTLQDEISKIVRTENIDLIVMGTKGATGAKEILFGTQTVHIIKKAKCPVVAVPPQFKYEAPKEILFPTDFEIEYKKEKLESLIALISLHHSRINVMHVRTGHDLTAKQEKNKADLEELFDKKALFHELPDNGVIAAVNEFQIKTKINLLVMVQNKHTFLERLFILPLLKKIGCHITVPFMVLPE